MKYTKFFTLCSCSCRKLHRNMKVALISVTILLFGNVAILAQEESISKAFKYFLYDGKGYGDTSEQDTPSPVIPGWASDPSICRVGKDYWLVTSTFGYFPGVPLYHSTDLKHWELVRNIIDRKSQLPDCYQVGARSLDRGGIYAPTIRYNERNKTYYMITTDVSTMNSGGKGGHFFMTAKNPRGEWSDAVSLPDIDGIDPSFFFDEDGQAYIIYKEDVTGQPKWNLHRALRIIRFDTEKGCTVGQSIPFSEVGVGEEEHLGRDEGPHIYKKDGKYIIVAAEGGTGIYHSAVCYKADNVFGPYTRWSRNPMLTQRYLKSERPYAVTCTGHADIVETPEGKWFAVFLGVRNHTPKLKDETSTDLGRETFLMPVKWSKDGFPYITQEKDTVPNLACPLTWRDDFQTKALRPEWIGDPNIPGFHGIRLQHHAFNVETQIDLKTMERENLSSAGIMFLKTESCQYRFVTNGKTISLITIGKKGKQDIVATHDLSTDEQQSKSNSTPLTLKASSDGSTISFYYSDNKLVGTLPINNLSNAKAGGFTGITVGVFEQE